MSSFHRVTINIHTGCGLRSSLAASLMCVLWLNTLAGMMGVPPDWRPSRDPLIGGFPARSGHSACVVGSSVYVFGGTDGVQRLGDMHCYFIEMQRWVPVQTSGTAFPSPR